MFFIENPFSTPQRQVYIQDVYKTLATDMGFASMPFNSGDNVLLAKGILNMFAM